MGPSRGTAATTVASRQRRTRHTPHANGRMPIHSVAILGHRRGLRGASSRGAARAARCLATACLRVARRVCFAMPAAGSPEACARCATAPMRMPCARIKTGARGPGSGVELKGVYIYCYRIRLSHTTGRRQDPRVTRRRHSPGKAAIRESRPRAANAPCTVPTHDDVHGLCVSGGRERRRAGSTRRCTLHPDLRFADDQSALGWRYPINLNPSRARVARWTPQSVSRCK